MDGDSGLVELAFVEGIAPVGFGKQPLEPAPLLQGERLAIQAFYRRNIDSGRHERHAPTTVKRRGRGAGKERGRGDLSPLLLRSSALLPFSLYLCLSVFICGFVYVCGCRPWLFWGRAALGGICSSWRSGVADAGVLRQEEPREQGVYPQQPFSRQGDYLCRSRRQIARRVQRVELIAEPVQNVDAVFVPEVWDADGAKLKLQHELADHAFFAAGPVRTAQGDIAVTDGRAVIFPRIEVLDVDTVDMAKRRHSQACHVGAAPKPVAVNEARAGRILDGGIRAPNVITR